MTDPFLISRKQAVKACLKLVRKFEREQLSLSGIEGREFVQGQLSGATQCGEVVAALPAATQGWVSVKERLPEPGSTVLGLWRNMEAQQESAYAVVHCATKHHWHNPDDDEDDFCAPTHWQPLPQPPAATEGEGK